MLALLPRYGQFEGARRQAGSIVQIAERTIAPAMAHAHGIHPGWDRESHFRIMDARLHEATAIDCSAAQFECNGTQVTVGDQATTIVVESNHDFRCVQ